MKIKIGPIEIEQESVADNVLFEEYKKSEKDVTKYLEEKSKFFDLTLKNIIAGKTMKMIRDFIFTIIGGVVFIGWSIYVFYISKDSFVWNEMNLRNQENHYVIYLLHDKANQLDYSMDSSGFCILSHLT